MCTCHLFHIYKHDKHGMLNVIHVHMSPVISHDTCALTYQLRSSICNKKKNEICKSQQQSYCSNVCCVNGWKRAVLCWITANLCMCVCVCVWFFYSHACVKTSSESHCKKVCFTNGSKCAVLCWITAYVCMCMCVCVSVVFFMQVWKPAAKFRLLQRLLHLRLKTRRLELTWCWCCMYVCYVCMYVRTSIANWNRRSSHYACSRQQDMCAVCVYVRTYVCTYAQTYT